MTRRASHRKSDDHAVYTGGYASPVASGMNSEAVSPFPPGPWSSSPSLREGVRQWYTIHPLQYQLTNTKIPAGKREGMSTVVCGLGKNHCPSAHRKSAQTPAHATAMSQSPDFSQISNFERSPWGISWSCLAVIIACAWKAIHLDVPTPTSSRQWWRRTRMTLWTIFVPEFAIRRAAIQWFRARQVSGKHNDKNPKLPPEDVEKAGADTAGSKSDAKDQVGWPKSLFSRRMNPAKGLNIRSDLFTIN